MSLYYDFFNFKDVSGNYFEHFPLYKCETSYSLNKTHHKDKEENKLKSKQSRNAKLRNRIQRVKFDNPWTIVWWDDGSITRVKCSNLDTFNEEAGLMAAICKHYYEDTHIFGEMLHKWCKPTPKGYQIENINAAYDEGYDDGYMAGHRDGYDEGEYDGRSAGYDAGYDQGYHDGKEG